MTTSSSSTPAHTEMTPMKSQSNKQVMKNATLALSALVTLIGSTVVSAPAAHAAYGRIYDPATGLGSQNCIAQGLGPDQDSLLPPEVVPLDSTAGANYQASHQAAQMNPYTAPSAPNSPQAPAASAAAPAQAMQSSQEWRKAAFDSLMNNPGAQPVFGSQQPQMAANGANGQPGVGQSGWTGANGQPMQAPAQSQVLSGQAQQQSFPKKNSGPGKLSSVAHMASMATMFGSGALTGALMTRSYSPMGFYGPGLMGAGMMNYGLRNGFMGW